MLRVVVSSDSCVVRCWAAREAFTPQLFYQHSAATRSVRVDERSIKASKYKGKGSPYSITERRVPELIPVLGSQRAGDVSHKPGGRLPLLSARPALTPATLKGCYQFCCLVNRGTMGVNSLPKTVTRQRRDCDLNPGPSVPTK